MKFSLKQYALLLSVITIAIFLGFGWYTYQQVEDAKVTLADWKQETTRDELANAIKSVADGGNRAAQRFAEWQEVRQQIINPSFYPYWRDQRMMSTDFLPSNTLGANLYNARGESLLSVPVLNLPLRIDPGSMPGPYVTNDKVNGNQVAFFAPVLSQGGQTILGFISISLPFLPLLSDYHFQHIDEASIRLKSEIDQVPITDVAAAIAYEKKEDVSSIAVQTILASTTRTFIIASLLIAALLYGLLGYGVRKPLQLLIDHIHMLRKNPDLLHSGKFLKQLHVKELNEVGDALNAYQEELNAVYGSLDEKNKELLDLAYTDPLTGAKNRRSFNDHWEMVANIAESSRMDVCMMLFDINHFKAINDSYGHQVGDEVLIAVSRLVNAELRKGEHLYRLGGDEFGTVVINCSEEAGHDIANRCIESIAGFDFKSFGIMEKVRISIGVACAKSENKAELDNLGWQADSAVYLAKRPGNQNVVVYKPEMASSSKSLFSNYVYSAVFNAIEKGEGLKIHYQPIIDLDNGSAAYYESLVRIEHKGKIIPPSHIFPIITARNLDKEMDQVIVKAVIDDLEHKRIPDGTGVSINLSGPSVGSKDLVRWVSPLSKYLSDYKLVFEVTETTLISQMSRATENLNTLKEMGFLIALDDFGSGYSSLRYLGGMPVDVVKFDISLISELKSPHQRTLVYNLCNMIKEIGYEMVAEGIEDANTHKQIILAGFNYGQGYHFGKPAEVPAQNHLQVVKATA